ncbi:MAG TPA: helix-turn-helix transcriptional regulator [Gemmatimonadales bacterium]|nr:helix-turn-helix transcriptional regulator [Gemmatimonadales bacterium]
MSFEIEQNLEFWQAFGKKLRIRRLWREMTQAQLGLRLGLSEDRARKVVSRLERGGRRCDIREALALANALGVPLQELFP